LIGLALRLEMARMRAMTKVTHNLTYGSGSKALSFPQDFLLGEKIAPRTVEGGMSPRPAFAEALAKPEGTSPLRELAAGRRVGIVIADEFRAGLQKDILDTLIGEIAAARPEQASLMIATGSHDPKIYARNLIPAAQESAKRHGINLLVHGHDCDKSPHHEVGSTPMGSPVILDDVLLAADVRVYGHESKHHYMCGYSNIDKLVLPGMSARRTIEANHKRALDPDSQGGRSPYHPDPLRRRNPFAEDARDARALSERFFLDGGRVVERPVATFGLDMISEGGKVLWQAAGKPESFMPRMPEAVDKVGGFEVDRAQYVVLSPGGPPASQTLYSVQNCFDMALLGAIKRGGEALVVAPCDGRPDVPPDVRGLAPDASSKGLFYDGLVKLLALPFAESEAWIRDHFELYLWKTHRVLRLLKVDGVKLYLHSELDPGKVSAAGIVPVADPQAWIDERAARGDGKCRVIDGGNRILVVGKS
jgi:nickel-dependent lactate racemase